VRVQNWNFFFGHNYSWMPGRDPGQDPAFPPAFARRRRCGPRADRGGSGAGQASGAAELTDRAKVGRDWLASIGQAPDFSIDPAGARQNV
jgi:hypothetical protein